MLLANACRRCCVRASCDEGDQPRGACGGPGPLGEPGAEPGDVHGGARQQVLQPGAGQAAVAGMAQVAAGDAAALTRWSAATSPASTRCSAGSSPAAASAPRIALSRSAVPATLPLRSNSLGLSTL